MTAYSVLLVGDVDYRHWSAIVRGFSLVVWPVVWAGPAKFSTQMGEALQRHANDIVRQVTELKEGDDERDD